MGDFQLLQRLGRGGMGTVYLAAHVETGEQVAIKVLAPHIAADPELAERFAREVQVGLRVGHKNLIKVFSFGELADGRSYLVMELLRGESLAKRIERGAFQWGEVRHLFSQILDGLQAAHEGGVIHRDLKPENVFLIEDPQGGLPHVKIFDFGLAKMPGGHSGSLTRTGIALGTPRYMSPEQCRGRNVDHRTDLYAAGVMLYEAVTGRLPFESSSPLVLLSMQITSLPYPPSRLAELPDALEQVILRALAKDPEQRYANAQEMAAALQAVAPGEVPLELSRIGGPAPVLTEQPTSHGLAYESTVEMDPDEVARARDAERSTHEAPAVPPQAVTVPRMPAQEPAYGIETAPMPRFAADLSIEAAQPPGGEAGDDTGITRFWEAERRRSTRRVMALALLGALGLGVAVGWLARGTQPTPIAVPLEAKR